MNILNVARYRRELVIRSRSAVLAIMAVIAVAILAPGCSSDGDRNPEVELVLKTMKEGVPTAPGPVIWAGGQLFDPTKASNHRNDEAGRFWKRLSDGLSVRTSRHRLIEKTRRWFVLSRGGRAATPCHVRGPKEDYFRCLDPNNARRTRRGNLRCRWDAPGRKSGD